MSRFVVDSNVLAKWFAPEEHSEVASLLLDSDHELVAPEFFAGEVANALVKKVRQHQFEASDVWRAVERTSGQVSSRSATSLLELAVEIALAYGRNAFDSMYLVLAIQTGCQYITADRRAYEALRGDFATNLLWVEDIPSPV